VTPWPQVAQPSPQRLFPCCHPPEDCCFHEVVTCVFVDISRENKRSSGALPSTALEDLFDDVKRHKTETRDSFHSDVFEIRRRREVRREPLPTWPPPGDRRLTVHPAFPGCEFADYSENDDEWGWFVASDNRLADPIDIHAAMQLCTADNADDGPAAVVRENIKRDTLETVTSEDLLME